MGVYVRQAPLFIHLQSTKMTAQGEVDEKVDPNAQSENVVVRECLNPNIVFFQQKCEVVALGDCCVEEA